MSKQIKKDDNSGADKNAAVNVKGTAKESPQNPDSNSDGTVNEKKFSGHHASKVEAQRGKDSDVVKRLEELENKLEELRGENSRLHHQFKLAVADRENERRIMNKKVSDAEIYSVSSFAKDIVAACDNLERVVANLQESDKLHSGILMTWNELQKALASHGVMKIDAYGKDFDPDLHQAVGEVKAPANARAGTVVEVLQQGYTIHGRLLRPSLVNLAKASQA